VAREIGWYVGFAVGLALGIPLAVKTESYITLIAVMIGVPIPFMVLSGRLWAKYQVLRIGTAGLAEGKQNYQ
jgi:hypothetical protein